MSHPSTLLISYPHPSGDILANRPAKFNINKTEEILDRLVFHSHTWFVAGPKQSGAHTFQHNTVRQEMWNVTRYMLNLGAFSVCIYAEAVRFQEVQADGIVRIATAAAALSTSRTNFQHTKRESKINQKSLTLVGSTDTNSNRGIGSSPEEKKKAR